MNFFDFLAMGVRLSLPLIFAAYGGMFSERAGVANIALEGFLLFSSFAAAATMTLTGNLPLSFAAGVLLTLVVALIFCFFTLRARADQIITGMAINLLAMGVIPVLCKALFGSSGQTPSLPMESRFSQPWLFWALALLTVVGSHFYFSTTVLGIRAWAAGENPRSLTSQGVKVQLVRLQSILIGAAIASLGGIYLSMGVGSGYTRNMSAGRGFIALAALIFGRWKPWPTLVGCLLFGFSEAAQILLQGATIAGHPIPIQFVQTLPYVLTLMVLAGGLTKARAPAAINR